MGYELGYGNEQHACVIMPLVKWELFSEKHCISVYLEYATISEGIALN